MKECPICLKSKKQVQSLYLKTKICSTCSLQKYLSLSGVCKKMGFGNSTIQNDLRKELAAEKWERVPENDAFIYIKGRMPSRLWSTKIIDARMDGWPDLIESEVRQLNAKGFKRKKMAVILGVSELFLNHFCSINNIKSVSYLYQDDPSRQGEDYSNFIRAESLFNKAMRG